MLLDNECNVPSVNEGPLIKSFPPQPGRNGRLLLMVKPYRRFSKEPLEIIDRRFIRHFDNVECGQIVARVYAPQPGVPGCDALGQEIPARRGKEANCKIGENLQLLSENSDYQTVVATAAGYLVEDKGTLQVKTVFEHSGNVDLRSGDIDFSATVKIAGEIRPDFFVRARHDISVSGDTRGRVCSQEGNVHINGTCFGESRRVVVGQFVPSGAMGEVLGMKRLQVSSAQSVYLGSADGASIEAGRDLHVMKSVRNCNLHIQGDIFVKEQLCGGKTYLAGHLKVGTLGSNKEINTPIFIAVGVETSAAYLDYQQRIDEIGRSLTLIENNLGPYLDNVAARATLIDNNRRKIATLLEQRDILLKLREQWLTAQAQLVAKHSPVVQQEIKASMAIYPGVVISAGRTQFVVSETLSGEQCIVFDWTTKAFRVVNK